ncbi:hypothetical protein RP20_CCG011773 [Aedes albopictus]|nr:hypothetical protein RP20_CCG011773 [Aedes albopictus]
MSKKIRTLEKETITWKTKWERSNAALIDLMSEKQVRDEHIMKTARQLFQLQKLCRTLQNERTAYFKALEDNKVEIPQIVEVPSQMPEPEPLPVPTKKQEDRLEIMTKSCSALKENLAALQGQLSAIQNVEPKKEDTPASVNGQTQPQGKKGKKDKKGKGAKTVEPEPEGNQKTNGVEGDNSNSTVEAAAPTQAEEPSKSAVDETVAEEPKPESTEEKKPADVVETTESKNEQPQPASEAVQQAEPAVVVAT